MGDKRGSHLSLTLARLDDLVMKAGGTRLQRIGLSATVRPIEDVARFLHGSDLNPGRAKAGAPALTPQHPPAAAEV